MKQSRSMMQLSAQPSFQVGSFRQSGFDSHVDQGYKVEYLHVVYPEQLIAGQIQLIIN